MKTKSKLLLISIPFIFTILILMQNVLAVCEESWTCTDWSECVDGIKTRICIDLNSCGTTDLKPAEEMNCTVNMDDEPTCTILWYCGPWSDYCSNHTQYRECVKLNDCENSISSEPETERYCDFDCYEEWECSEWGYCNEDGTQTRECYDTHNCGTEDEKPNETQECEYCPEFWKCTDWSECSMDGIQTRECIDANNCGTFLNKPEEIQECEYICLENWSCSDWGGCLNGTQTRTCTDSNNCDTENNKPITMQSCIVNNTNRTTTTASSTNETCTELWTCTSWGVCQPSNTQTRICTDSNNCNTENNKPAESQSCTYSSESSSGGGSSSGSGSSSSSSTISNYDVCENRTWRCEPNSECINGKQEYLCEDITPVEQCRVTKADRIEIRNCSVISSVKNVELNEIEINNTDVNETYEANSGMDQITGNVILENSLSNKIKQNLLWIIPFIIIISYASYFSIKNLKK
jgi:hypothetical protein